jgi:arylsulfatase A-like enzyme
MMIRRVIVLAIASICSACSSPPGESTPGEVPDTRPNILLIVADDLGYADLGAYGGDIQTPNIDSLAAEGLLMTQFHTGPSCALTRAMLFSGNNNHVAGMARQSQIGVLGAPVSGYESSLSDRIMPFPRLLQDVGYHTYMAGKWHLGTTLETSPYAAGFSRSFALLDGAGSHFNATGIRPGGSRYLEDQDFVEWPEGRYSTDLYTDRLIEFMDSNQGDGKPFFVFAAYTSPHWPLQVPDEYLELYAGQYDDGYDALRLQRFDSLKEAGVIPLSSELPPRNDTVRLWDDLTSDEKRIESRKMELYAAMVDNLDDHVGRLVDYLKSNDLYENTVIVFMSDNGADGGDFYNRSSFTDYLQANYTNTYENMGKEKTFISYDRPWAEAGSVPFDRVKGYTRQGGIVASMMVAGPGVATSGAINSSFMTVMDLAPTFLDIAGAKYPDDGSVRPMLGESATRFLAGDDEAIHDENYIVTQFAAGRAYLRQGRWKIANVDGPFRESDFELFDLQADPGESMNLADAEPEKHAELIALWRVERKKLGIILPEDL